MRQTTDVLMDISGCSAHFMSLNSKRHEGAYIVATPTTVMFRGERKELASEQEAYVWLIEKFPLSAPGRTVEHNRRDSGSSLF
jgi:hypothetical protein